MGHNENVVFTLGGKGDKYETSHLMREKVSNTIYVVNFWLNRCILKSQGFFRLKVVSIYMRENMSLQIISRSIFDSDMELCLFRVNAFFFVIFFFSCELLMNPIHSSTLDLIVLSSMSSITRYRAYESILCFLFAIQQLVLESRKNTEIE